MLITKLKALVCCHLLGGFYSFVSQHTRYLLGLLGRAPML